MLSFMGRNTTELAFDSSVAEVKEALEFNEFIGDIHVEINEVDDFTKEWLVHFNTGKSGKIESLRNYGNLSELSVVYSNANISVSIATIQDGFTPYRALVRPSIPSATHTFASDYPGIPRFEGKRTGIFGTKSNFKVHMVDKFLNGINSGPVSEVQVTLSASNILSTSFAT